MASSFFKLNMSDVWRGLVTAVFTALIVTLAGIVSQPTFDLFTADWASIVRTAVNASFAAFIGYLSKNLLTDSQGKVFGRI